MTTDKTYKVWAWLIFVLGALFYCYEYFLRIMPSVMYADIMRVFSINGLLFGSLSVFYYYAYTPMQPVVGILMDRYGPRRLLTVACLLCAVGAYLFAQTSFLSIAEFARFIIGFGSAFAFVGILKLITIWFPPSQFAFLSGLAAALGSSCAMLSEISLSTMVDFLGWRTTVLFSAALGVVLTVIIYFIVRDRNPNIPPEEHDHHALSFKKVFMELWQLLKNKQIWVNGMIAGLLYLPVTTFAELWGYPYLHQAYHFSKQAAAEGVSILFLGFTVGAPLMGFISDKIRSRRKPLMAGAVIAAILFTLLIYLPGLSQWQVFALLFISAMCYGSQVIVFAVACEISSKNARGSAIAVTNMFAMLGGVIFQPVIGFFLDLGWHGDVLEGVRYFPDSDYQHALIILPLGLIASAVCAYFLQETRFGDKTQTATEKADTEVSPAIEATT